MIVVAGGNSEVKMPQFQIKNGADELGVVAGILMIFQLMDSELSYVTNDCLVLFQCHATNLNPLSNFFPHALDAVPS